MSALLALPGYGVVLLRRGGWPGALRHAALFLFVQLALGAPFLLAAPGSYLGRAFELTRVFEWRWSVNWAFVSPELFVSPAFSAALLALHALLLLLLAQFRWGGVASLLRGRKTGASAAFAVRAPLESLLAGIVCARTLHYQFWALYQPALLLLLLCGWPRARVLLWAAAELVFNLYPPRPWAALLLQAAHWGSLACVLSDPVVN